MHLCTLCILHSQTSALSPSFKARQTPCRLQYKSQQEMQLRRKSSSQESLGRGNEEVSLPAAPAAADPQKAHSSEAVPSAAEPTAAAGHGTGD